MENTKAKVSSAYLDRMRELHGHKQFYYAQLRVMMTGASREGSIGQAIANRIQKHLYCDKLWSSTFDVRDSIPPSMMMDFNTLILCHGVTRLDWFEDLSFSEMCSIINVNVTGTIKVIQNFVKDTIGKDERKRIIVIGSMAHNKVLNGSAVYCASKAAVAHLVRCLAWELAPKGFDVFCIHPSNTEGTPMSEETIEGLMRYRGMDRGQAEAYWNDSPIRSQILQTSDIAELVMHLLGPEGAYLSGCQLEMAGGQR
jgi:NAD(P)-dependent dehydrogenase (short-subunit alcohol dehydrogenase family)